MPKKILITGGSGFIASFLVEELVQKGHVVTIFDTAKPIFTPLISFIQGDVTDRRAVEKACQNQEIIFHYAGILGTHETVEIAYEAAKVNVLGALNVFDAALKSGAVVFDVTKPNFWRNPYTITKIAAEEFGLMYRDEFNLPVVLLRYFNVYGPRQKTDIYQKAVPTFIVKALGDEPLPVFGNGRQGTDHIYVEDAIHATVMVLEKVLSSGSVPENAVEIGSGDEVTVNTLATEIIRMIGSSSKIEYVPMRRGETENTRIRADISYLRDVVGFLPKYSLEDGLRRTIVYYRNSLALDSV